MRGLIVLIVSACSLLGMTAKVSAADIEGQHWSLQSFGYSKTAVPERAYIKFENGRYSGFAGCNRFGGKYTIRGNSLTLKPGMMTRMACGQMALEIRYMRALGIIDNYDIKENKLLLKHGKFVFLIFSKKKKKNK